MMGKTKVIYGDVTYEELKQIMEDYDFIVDMRSVTSEPLDNILAKGKPKLPDGRLKKKIKPKVKIGMW